MKKYFLVALIIIISLSLFGCVDRENEVEPQQQEQPGTVNLTDESDQAAVAGLVEDFGSRLQAVSLLAPEDIAKKSLQENYKDLVSVGLLSEWLADPQSAPGRWTSSPWPDRIDILNIDKLSEDKYQVKGEIIIVSSTEKGNGGFVAKRPVTLEVEKIEGQWLIFAAAFGDYEDTGAVVYSNNQYGFNFSLPGSWKGYSIITGTWEGFSTGGPQGNETAATGPILSIRHPQWTSENQRQDIPIMVFTISQWESLQKDEFHIGAAPVGPSELGRNSKYVFALPARYNFSFLEGYEEVANILEGTSLQVNENYEP